METIADVFAHQSIALSHSTSDVSRIPIDIEVSSSPGPKIVLADPQHNVTIFDKGERKPQRVLLGSGDEATEAV